ncbi:MAG: AAA family ATPase [Capsulimonadales bacterium]|nr:AAA family ATPase [Capsulimonadales bacterium]
MLYVFGGLPGTGKTTLARSLAGSRRAVYLRVDTIEQAIRDAGGRMDGPEGYHIAYRLAVENLRIGLSVVADTVNPLRITREAWRTVAKEALSPFVEIEVVCSDPEEHRARVENRIADIEGFSLPTWEDVLRRFYETWDGDRIVLDTAGQTPERSYLALENRLAHLP